MNAIDKKNVGSFGLQIIITFFLVFAVCMGAANARSGSGIQNSLDVQYKDRE